MGSRTDVRPRDRERAALESTPESSALAEGWVAVRGTVHTQSRGFGGALAACSLLSALWIALHASRADASTALVLLPFIGVLAGLVLHSARAVDGAVWVGHRAVRVVHKGRVRQVPIVRAASYSAQGEGLLRLETARGQRFSIRCDEQELDRLLRASALDALESRGGASAGLLLWSRFALAVGAGSGGLAVAALLGLGDQTLAAGGIVGILLGAWLTRPSTIEQGLDGVASSGRNRWSLPWSNVASVVIDRSALVIRARNGATYTAQAATSLPSVVSNRYVDLDLLLLMGRVERAFAQVKSAPPLPESLSTLARNARPVPRWIEHLSLSGPSDAPFRSANVESELLARALVHPACAPDVRVACAWILCAREPAYWRPRVREVAEACVVVSTRRALEAVSNGAPFAVLWARVCELEA